MVNVDVKGCESFVKEEQFNAYVQKAMDAFDVLESEKGAGNDFLGWKHLPSQISDGILNDMEAIRESWNKKGLPGCQGRY